MIWLIFIIGLFAGIPLGWTFNFVNWYRKKKSLRWAWLLCKPLPLTAHENTELFGFYVA